MHFFQKAVVLFLVSCLSFSIRSQALDTLTLTDNNQELPSMICNETRILQQQLTKTGCPLDCTSCYTKFFSTELACYACVPDAQINPNTGLCAPICNRTYQYYMKSNKKCIDCPFTTVPDQINQKCSQCSAFCIDCYFNATTGDEVCNACQSPAYLYTPTDSCALECDSRSYFNPKLLHCMSVACNYTTQTSYLNKTSGKCEKCPKNCTNCINNGTFFNDIQCTACIKNFVVDPIKKVCRQNCLTQWHLWDPNDGLCKLCANGTYPDQNVGQCVQGCLPQFYYDNNQQLCFPCPDGCSNCNFDSSSGTVQCQQCLAPLTKLNDAFQSGCKMGYSNSQQLNSNSLAACSGSWSGNIALYGSSLCAPGWQVCSNDQNSLQIMGNYNMDSFKSFQGCYALNMARNSSSNCISCDPSNNGASVVMSGIGSGCTFYSGANSCLGNQIRIDIRRQLFQLPCQYHEGVTSGVACCKKAESVQQLQLDSSIQCISRCPDDSFYSLAQGQCIQCNSNQYANPLNQNCVNCPQNCLTCKKALFNSSDQEVICTQCRPGFVPSYDPLNKYACKRICNQTSIYNYAKDLCQACPNNFYRPLPVNSSEEVCIDSGYRGCNQVIQDLMDNSTSGIICLTCRSYSYSIDSLTRACRRSCAAGNIYYNYYLDTCIACNRSQYADQVNQVCQNCPKYCTSCFYNSTSQRPECRGCSDGSKLDLDTNKCRPFCNFTSYYNFTQNQCVNCDDSKPILYEKHNRCRFNCQGNTPYYVTSLDDCINCDQDKFFDFKKEACVNCPANCSSCIGSTACVGCTNDWILDIDNTKVCKPNCNSTSYYNQKSRQCQLCPARHYQNLTTQDCKPCPANCLTCQQNSQDNSVQCLTCTKFTNLDPQVQLCLSPCQDGQYLDYTTLNCTSCKAQQYFNETEYKCLTCPQNCLNCTMNINTNNADCTLCKDGFVYDSLYKNCRRNCSQGLVFDWASNNCINCEARKYGDPNTQNCLNCPIGCSSCSLFQIGNNQVVKCQTCDSGFVQDPRRMTCRKVCNGMSYYNWDLDQCIQCSSNQYPNEAELSCVNCPTGCQTCFSNNGSVSCTSCQNLYEFNPFNRQCRLSCNNISYYAWPQDQCVQCNVGTYPNAVNQTCSQCPNNCFNCWQSSSVAGGQPICSLCNSNFTSTSTQMCQKQCNTTQHFDASVSVSDCQNCRPECASCSNGNNCDVCQPQFNIQSDGSCQLKCPNTAMEMWNQKIQQCETIIFGIQLLPVNTQTAIRCNDIIIESQLLGTFDTSQIIYQWSISVINSSQPQTQNPAWLTRIQQHLLSLNKNTSTLNLTKIYTEQVPDNTTILISLEADYGFKVSIDSVAILVFPRAFSLFTSNNPQTYNSSSNVTIRSGDGYKFTLYTLYPDCPTQSNNYQVVPVNTTNCQASITAMDPLDNIMVVYKNYSVTDYQVRPYELPSLYTFYYQVVCQFPYQQDSTIQMIINTVSSASCQIQSNTTNRIYASVGSTITFTATFQNLQSNFYYQMKCNPPVDNQALPCPFNIVTLMYPYIQARAPTSISNGSVYIYTLQIMNANTGGLENTCSALIESVSKTPIPLNLNFYNLTDYRNFISPQFPQLFTCNQIQELIMPIIYSWSVKRRSDGAFLMSNSRTSLPTITLPQSNQLLLQRGSIASSQDYDITCTATNLKYTGTLTQTYTTKNLLTNANLVFLTVSPTSGVDQETTFTFTVIKSAQMKVACVITQLQWTGNEVVIFSQSNPNYDNQDQVFSGVLQTTLFNQSLQIFYAVCNQQGGLQYRAPVTVNITQPITNFLGFKNLEETQNSHNYTGKIIVSVILALIAISTIGNILIKQKSVIQENMSGNEHEKVPPPQRMSKGGKEIDFEEIVDESTPKKQPGELEFDEPSILPSYYTIKLIYDFDLVRLFYLPNLPSILEIIQQKAYLINVVLGCSALPQLLSLSSGLAIFFSYLFIVAYQIMNHLIKKISLKSAVGVNTIIIIVLIIQTYREDVQMFYGAILMIIVFIVQDLIIKMLIIPTFRRIRAN